MSSGISGSYIWGPANTASPGFNPIDPLHRPGRTQAKKNLRHGTSGGTGLYAGGLSAPSSAIFMPTQFLSGVNVDALANDVWRNGFILHSKKKHYPPSLFRATPSALGFGVIGGCAIVASGIRAVRPDDPRELHYFADTIRPDVDAYAECPACHAFYPASAIPQHCNCGWPLADW